MKVELLEIHPRNFRCFYDSTFAFEHTTIVRGTNGTGKTTLFDAFMFTLFGKDSKGRSDFGYKRRDKDGKIVHELEYGCEVVLSVDGKEKRFERVAVEKWTKPKTESKPVLTGNVFYYYVDRVRTSKTEYDAAVSDIVSEDVFRTMTDVYFFMNQKDEYKKEMLMRIAYGSSDPKKIDEWAVSDVLENHPDLKEFYAKLNGSSIKDYNEKIGKKIRSIKDELGTIPIKIGAKKESMPPAEDWDMLQDIINANKEELAEVVKQIESEDARRAGATKAVNALRSDLSNKQVELLQRENAIRSEVMNAESGKRQALIDADCEYTAKMREYNQMSERINAKKQEVAAIVSKYDLMIEANNHRIEELNSKVVRLRGTYKAIKNDTYQYTDDELECPTCHRPYDKDRLKEQKLAENVSTGKRIVNVDIAQLQEEITLIEKKKNDELEVVNKEIAELDKNMRQSRSEIDSLYKKKESLTYQPADVDKLIKEDEACQTFRKEMEDIRAKIAASTAPQQPSALITTKQEIESKISGFQQKLGARETIERIEAQITELEEKSTALNKELGELEKLQETAYRYQRAKDNHMMERVNRKFRIVTWDFVSEQYNGNDRIACNCYVQGIPYAERNHAGKVNAGLDIINAISNCEGVQMPIFIDNAESVVEYPNIDSQLILLTVDPSCHELKFEM